MHVDEIPFVYKNVYLRIYIMHLHSEFAHYNLTYTETVTCKYMLERGSQTSARGSILIMPNHHINESGDFCGFRYSCEAASPLSTFPMTNSLFRGSTVCECVFENDTQSMEFLANVVLQKEEFADKLSSFIGSLKNNDLPPKLDHIPENINASEENMDMRFFGRQSVDIVDWHPEVPYEIGIYHSFVRSFSEAALQHKIFIYCNSGCAYATNELLNLKNDLGDKIDCGTFADSEEIWWLRKAVSRSRSRLCFLLAKEFNLVIPSTEDLHRGTSGHMIAIPTIETFEHDIRRDSRDSSMVNSYCGCVDTTILRNGMILRGAPSQGLYIIRGPARSGPMRYGGGFGDSTVCGCLPTYPAEFNSHLSSYDPNDPNDVVLSNVKPIQARTIKRIATPSRDDDEVSLLEHSGNPAVYIDREIPQSGTNYVQVYDESYMNNLSKMQWNRDNGVVELIPICSYIRR